MKRTQLFFVNAMIMTATSMTANGAGVWFNLYVSERLGAESMGIYQLILSVYTFTVTLASFTLCIKNLIVSLLPISFF